MTRFGWSYITVVLAVACANAGNDDAGAGGGQAANTSGQPGASGQAAVSGGAPGQITTAGTGGAYTPDGGASSSMGGGADSASVGGGPSNNQGGARASDSGGTGTQDDHGGAGGNAGAGGVVPSATNLEIVSTLPATEACAQLAHDGTYLYCGPLNAASLRKLDPSTGNVVGTFDLSRASQNVSDTISFVSGGGGYLYVVPSGLTARPYAFDNRTYPHVAKFDPATGVELGRVITNSSIQSIYFRGGLVYAGDHLVMRGQFDTAAGCYWYCFTTYPGIGCEVPSPWAACGLYAGEHPTILHRVMYGAAGGALRCVPDNASMNGWNIESDFDDLGPQVATPFSEPVLSVASDGEFLWAATASSIYKLREIVQGQCAGVKEAGGCSRDGEGDVYHFGSGGAAGTGGAGSGTGATTGSGATGSGATGSGATGSGATGSGATGAGATGSGASGAVGP